MTREEEPTENDEATATLDAVVEDYIERHRERAIRELRYFQVQRSDEDAISRAALAELPSG